MAARNQLVDALHEAIILFSRNTRVRANQMYDGMSFVAYSVLSYVGGRRDATASGLADSYHLEKSTVSRQLSELEAAGLLRRSANTDQPRTKRLELTAEGRRRLLDIRAHQRNGLQERLSSWSDEDVTRFAELFGRFVHDL
ncbi:MarR family transcriptional regulator [Amycolatopsis mediterranei S699]|uniref:MarR family transcriptional regulator n=2 Tax=Amycolatopsis mediterranei TaxID=33910 RepID=A0A0H3CY61_AMYMU|nr:MarR family transcriptional regulator [Amycolatopsis mediterranei]ADJ43268.1 MarR family transcriptional regulator [Amycolatopsis mediterranei U32]AEK39969.1 MarR family transcriptional regulator [Amycolatopsis mediterranei S699]AFO74981.1 MarR family transcriptional regulator [Amycolatopsis mediterranei S699]AGT82110.1 MarR family transcriptional regulator [Amycolatopsis mediterranei RB]KDO11143.1 MarR family transcriptional regulator [Amycolatopsis mediterranei]